MRYKCTTSAIIARARLEAIVWTTVKKLWVMTSYRSPTSRLKNFNRDNNTKNIRHTLSSIIIQFRWKNNITMQISKMVFPEVHEKFNKPFDIFCVPNLIKFDPIARHIFSGKTGSRDFAKSAKHVYPIVLWKIAFLVANSRNSWPPSKGPDSRGNSAQSLYRVFSLS